MHVELCIDVYKSIQTHSAAGLPLSRSLGPQRWQW
jgi:hypothetical protein